ncbi:carboxylate-amine ligase [Faunimonas sp. B44]|uniref:carboxylate-amine ligase n=1 Tax=Faunimonas sp. B44 TaxID=3461493 RepID=UPI0040446D0E
MRDLPPLTVGVEEEYLLVDLETRDLAVDPPPALMEALGEILGRRVAPEFLRCQIEVGTEVCTSMPAVRSGLASMRASIADEARRHGLAPIAASTHPFADWSRQRSTDKDRYRTLAEKYQVVAHRLLVSGMHVHVAVEDEDLRIDLHNQLIYFLPHLLALSTSSPFWRGRETGLKSYRLGVLNELPRAGLPPVFESASEYRRLVRVLTECRLIEDATRIWWDLRPSARYPTLEMRITDTCTRLADAVAVASLYRCIVRMLCRLKRNNQRWRHYPLALISENRWLAQRHGPAASLIDFGKAEAVPLAALVEELLALVAEDSEALECRAEVEHVRRIVAEGTSADRQVATYRSALEAGQDEQGALRAVVDHLVRETLEGCDTA